MYAPDLDAIGHKRGWQSDEWVAALERVDAAARALSRRARRAATGAVVTADHGMVDVPRHRHVLLDRRRRDLVDGVRHIGGEPRMLHLYAEAGRGGRRAASLAGGGVGALLGALARRGDRGRAVRRRRPTVLPRIGDVIVAARSGIAYYDDRLEDKGAQRMVGQHGSLTNEERTVPLIRLGAFA